MPERVTVVMSHELRLAFAEKDAADRRLAAFCAAEAADILRGLFPTATTVVLDGDGVDSGTFHTIITIRDVNGELLWASDAALQDSDPSRDEVGRTILAAEDHIITSYDNRDDWEFVDSASNRFSYPTPEENAFTSGPLLVVDLNAALNARQLI